MTRKPNVIIFLTDDQGYGDLSKSGNQNLLTPIADDLEVQGARMENFYTCPLCAPTRAELLTGRQFIKTGVHGVTQKAEYINLDEKTIAEVYKEAGYSTGCFGKWHSGSLFPYHPNARGFDEFYGFCCGHWGYYFNTTMDHNGVEVRGKNYIIDDVTDHVLDFIEENSDREFFCYVPYNTPHSPYQVPEEFYGKFRDAELISRADDREAENVQITKAVMAMCENIDWNMGRVIKKLAEKNLERDTIIVYLSDNGPAGSVRFNSGMKGVKGGIDEGSVRTACSISWKDHIMPNTVVQQLGSTMDFLPTLTALCDVPCNTEKPIDGIDLSRHLLGKTTEIVEREVFALQSWSKTGISVRDQRYRYLYDENELYDIENDRGQKNNIAESEPERVEAMRKSCQSFTENFVPKSYETRYLPIGYSKRKAYLNAQDADPNGKITWSSIHPNCSYLINWDDDGDTVDWVVDVVQSGKYRASVLYTCTEKSVGKTLVVSCGEERCKANIEIEFNPELDEMRDYSPRTESYTKQFKELYVGELYIEKGLNTLTLSCEGNDGNHICDVRALMVEI